MTTIDSTGLMFLDVPEKFANYQITSQQSFGAFIKDKELVVYSDDDQNIGQHVLTVDRNFNGNVCSFQVNV